MSTLIKLPSSGISRSELETGFEFETSKDVNDTDTSSDGSDSDTFEDDTFADYKQTLNEAGEEELADEPFEVKKSKMEPVREDGGIMKRIIRWGTGLTVPEKSTVVLNYEGFLEYEHEPFDSTYCRRRPFKFLMEEGSIIPGLYFAVKSMKKDEISEFIIDSEYAYGSMGCLPRIPEDATLRYKVQILEFKDTKGVIEFEDMSPEEQRKAPFEKIDEVCKTELETGNEFYRRKRYRHAIRYYHKVLALLEAVSVKNEDEEMKRYKHLVKGYRNIALAYLNVHNAKKAHIFASLALQLDENDEKAWFIKGKACMIDYEFDRGREFLFKASKLRPGCRDISAALHQLNKLQREAESNDRDFCKRIFSFDNSDNNNVQEVKVTEEEEGDEVRTVIKECLEKFVESSEREYLFSSGLSESQIQIVKSLAAKYDLHFFDKIHDEKIIKVCKK